MHFMFRPRYCAFLLKQPIKERFKPSEKIKITTHYSVYEKIAISGSTCIYCVN